MPARFRAEKKCTLTVTCVIACEINPPEGVKPLEWRLLTNRTVETPRQAMEIEEPSIQEVVRKCDGEPGVKTLWRGYRRVRTFVEGLQNLRQLGIEG